MKIDRQTSFLMIETVLCFGLQSYIHFVNSDFQLWARIDSPFQLDFHGQLDSCS